jgi:hypothetical protein
MGWFFARVGRQGKYKVLVKKLEEKKLLGRIGVMG